MGLSSQKPDVCPPYMTNIPSGSLTERHFEQVSDGADKFTTWTIMLTADLLLQSSNKSTAICGGGGETCCWDLGFQIHYGSATSSCHYRAYPQGGAISLFWNGITIPGWGLEKMKPRRKINLMRCSQRAEESYSFGHKGVVEICVEETSWFTSLYNYRKIQAEV